jgi:excisionase family DNA binding protein
VDSAKQPRRIRRHPQQPTELALTTEDLIRRRKLWPPEEAAHLLGITKTTLYRWADAGLITLIRVGGRTFVADSELDRFVARVQVESEKVRGA